VRRSLVVAVAVVVGLLALPGSSSPAAASWSGGGSGSGTARSTTLAAPGTLTATCNLLLSASVELNWGASSTPWVDGYEVRWGTTSGGPYPNSSGVVTALTYSTPALGTGTYYFVARATKGAWRGPDSNQVSKRITIILILPVCV
jgi:hypothetical protein